MPSSSPASYFGSAGLASGMSIGLLGVQIADDAAAERQRVAVVFGIIIGDAGFFRVHVGAAELFGGDHFAGRRFHQRRAAEKDRALVAHDDGLVRHRRHIGAARRARAHHHRDLGDAGRRQRRLIVEDAAEMLAVGKHVGLVRQVGAAGIDQIDARQPVLARDLLGAQMLLHRHRIIGAALDGGIVADDDAFAAGDAADAGDDAGAVDGVLVHAVGGERREFEERRAGIEQRRSRARAATACRAPDGARARAAVRLRPPRRGLRSSSAISARIAAWLARNSGDAVSILVLMAVTNPSHAADCTPARSRAQRVPCAAAHPAELSDRRQKGGARPPLALRAHFLALKHHVADDEQDDRRGDQADDLRPGDQHAGASGSGAPSTAPCSWLR